jgi:hypothetical protein
MLKLIGQYVKHNAEARPDLTATRKEPVVPPGIQIGIKRSGSSGHVSLQCDEDYCTIALYDCLVEAVQEARSRSILRQNIVRDGRQAV